MRQLYDLESAAAVLVTILAEYEGFAVGALGNCRVLLMSTDANSLKRAVVAVVCVVCALCYCAENRMVGLLRVIHNSYPSFVCGGGHRLSSGEHRRPPSVKLSIRLGYIVPRNVPRYTRFT